MTDDMKTRCGVVAILGAPNAGKSTLVNRLVGTKVTIVSPKVQTTRVRVRGVAIAGEAQIVYIDTPGIFEPKRRLDRAMVDAAWTGATDADEIVLLVDAERGIGADVRRILDGLAAQDRKAYLAINKVDAVRRDSLLALSQALNEAASFERTFMISAKTGDGVDDLQAFLAARMPAGPWLYPEDELSDLPSRLLAAEVTREKAFINLHQELPYALTVDSDAWSDFDDGSVRIDQTIYVARESQKGIVLGKGGAMIRRIRSEAQAELAAMLERPVHLFVHVKVREKWVDDPARYREWGLRFDA